MKVLLNVTEEDIKNGKRHSARSCPVALSLSRGAKADASVGPYHASIYYLRRSRMSKLLRIKGKVGMTVLPDNVANWIHAFDLGAIVAPFQTELEFEEWK